MEIVVVLWLLCGVACALIASSKNLSPVLWLFIGLVLGIIGLVLVAIVKKEEPKVASGPTSYWKCPSCGTMVHPGYNLCPHKIQVDGGKVSICNTPKPPPGKKCPQCAEIIKSEAKVCRFCQYKFLSDKTCPKCANVVTADANFCPFCQYKFEP